MSLTFKTFEEAREYIKKDPVGKSLVRLDNDSGFEVKSKNKYTQEHSDEGSDSSSIDDNKVLSKQDLRKVIGADFIYKTKYESKEDSFENKYKKVARNLKSSYRKKKKRIREATKISDARAKVVRPTQNDHKRYINETWGSRREWRTMSGRQSAINKSNKD